MSIKQLRGITPLFQQVLTKQIGKIMDALSEGEYEKAYADLKTLIDALREEDSDPLLENDVAHIDSLLKKARNPNSASFYQSLLETSANQEVVLVENLRLLFRKIMRILHKGGYLERVSSTPRYFEPGIKSEQIQ